jgi:type IV pilus assembly protein PilO
MPRNFDLRASLKDRRFVVRAILGTLLAANLVAAVFVFHPFGGSAEELERDMRDRQRSLAQQLQRLERTRNLVAKVEQAKIEGDHFLDQYILDRRSAFSILFGEVERLARDSGMKPKESSYVLDPVEGSETIEQLTISANYDGTYDSLTKFVNRLDKTSRFLIVQSMQASPQPSGTLNVNLRIDTFVRQAGKS